jgi:hypothetical protein
MRRPRPAGKPGSEISGLQPPCCGRWRSRALLLALALVAAGAGTAIAQQEKPDCGQLLARFATLIDDYHAAGVRGIEVDDPAVAIEKARKLAFKGDAEATVTMIGVGVALRGKKAAFPVAMIRQVCTFARKNKHPLHVVTCGYFNALNPLGSREEKRLAAQAEIARFEALDKTGAAALARYREPVALLKACVPQE